MKNFLEELGGEAELKKLVEKFYDLIEGDPRAERVGLLHSRGHPLSHTRLAQFEFLSGFLGGRAYYTERLGHMNLREIHAHVPIRTLDAEVWLETFNRALEECNLKGPVVVRLKGALSKAAHMLVNDVPDWRELD